MDQTESQAQLRQHEWEEAISAFTSLLEVMPEDLLALESLFEAYLNKGDRPNALQYLERLIQVLLKENERSIAAQLHEKLVGQANDVPEFVTLAKQLEPLLEAPEVEPQPATVPPPAAPMTARQQSDIQAELALAWKLFQGAELSQEDYSRVVQDLTDVSMRKSEVPVSVLHALHDRSFKNMDSVMNYLSKQSGRPIIALSHFELQRSAYTLLPLEVMTHWGAIVFDALGADLLVAVLNPFDQVLQNEVASLTGKTCHFFVISAPDYDHALEHIRKALRETPPTA